MTSPFLTTRALAIYLRLQCKDGSPDLKRAWAYIGIHQLPARRRGRTVLVHKDDVDASLVRRSA